MAAQGQTRRLAVGCTSSARPLAAVVDFIN
jgi:hypothetical protein